MRTANKITGLALIIVALASGVQVYASDGPTAVGAQGPVRAIGVDDLDSELAVIEARVKEIAGKLDFANKTYVLPVERRDSEFYEKKLSLAQILHFAKDYQSSAVVLFDLVGDSGFKSQPIYEEALNMLADSLYQIKDYYGARQYYLELARQGSAKFTQNALIRLIEISSETGDFEGIEEYSNLIKQVQSQSIASDVYYLLGKSLYKKGDISRAIDTLELVGTTSDRYTQARYLIGTILVVKGRMADALRAFEVVTAFSARTKADRQIQDMAWLAIGRIFYEMGKLNEATEAYQRIDRDSASFDESVYEVAWIHIKSGEYEKALRDIEILCLSTDETPLIVQAGVLRGNLLIKLGRYDEAEKVFQEVTERFGPMKDNLKGLIVRSDDPIRFFEKLAGQGMEQVEAQANLPALVVNWTSKDLDVTKAMGVAKNLGTSRKDIDESMKIADRLLATLEGENRINMFPALKEAKIRGNQVKVEIDDVRRSLNIIEDELISDYVSQSEKGQLAEVRQKRQALEKQVDQMPRTEIEYKSRASVVASRVRDLETQAFEMGLEIESLRAQLTAIDAWFYQSQGTRDDEESEVKLFHQNVKNEWESLNKINQEQKNLIAYIDREKAMMGLVTDMTVDERVRSAYRDAMDAEKLLMQKFRERLTGKAAVVSSRMDSLYSRIKALYMDLDKFDIDLNSKVIAKARDERTKILAEKRLLEGFNSEANMVEGETQTLVGRIALNGFRRTYRKFFDLVLQADVGIIDVVWDEEEAETRKIMKLQTDLGSEMKSINEQMRSGK